MQQLIGGPEDSFPDPMRMARGGGGGGFPMPGLPGSGGRGVIQNRFDAFNMGGPVQPSPEV